MLKPHEVDDKLAEVILALEESIFELEEIIENFNFSEKEKEDLITAKELAQSSRDLTICVIASKNGKRPPPHF